MPGPANVIVLAEDARAARLLRLYAQRALGVGSNRVRMLIAPHAAGDAKRYVIEQYANEVRRLRSAHASRCLLVHLDADLSTVAYRQVQLANSLQAQGLSPRGASEPIAHSIMARHVETWLAALNNHLVDLAGNPLDEAYDCKRKHFPRNSDSLVGGAAEALYEFTRANASEAPLPSIVASIVELQRLES